jgi:hypothetical protein
MDEKTKIYTIKFPNESIERVGESKYVEIMLRIV